MNKLITKSIYFFVLLATFSEADTLEDVTCFLSDSIPECIPSTSKTDRINVVLKPEYTVVKVEPINPTINPILRVETSSEWTLKDIVSAILATIGTAGFLLSLYNLYLSSKNRKNDKHSVHFHFWLKEIIYPQHIQPLIEKFTDIYRDYNCWSNLKESDPEKAIRRDRFMEAWPEKKLVLLNLLPNENSLPYLNEVFSNAKTGILALDELLLSAFLSDDIAIFPNDEEVIKADDSLEDDYVKGRKILNTTIQNVYTDIYNAQENLQTNHATKQRIFSKKGN